MKQTLTSTAKSDDFALAVSPEPVRLERNLPDSARNVMNLPEIWGTCQANLSGFEGNLAEI